MIVKMLVTALAVSLAQSSWQSAIAQQLEPFPLGQTFRPEERWQRVFVKPGDRITTADTRARERKDYKPQVAFPKPETRDALLSGTRYEIDGMPAVNLKQIVTTREKDRRFAPMVFSPDGRWLYVLDGNNVIHKLNAENLREEAILATGAECSDIAWSKEGLLVGVPSLLALWVLNADTLSVKFEIPADSVDRVAASATQNIGYAASQRGLHVVDLQNGQPLYFIDAMRLPAARITHVRTWNGQIYAMQVFDDAKYLFTRTVGQIHRLRIEGEHLFLEESTEDLVDGMATYFSASNDRNWIALPAEGRRIGSSPGIAIYDRQKLDRHILGIETGGEPLAIGFDSKTGNIYAPVDSKFHIFGQRGGKIKTLESPLTSVRRILVHPAGERVFLWSEQGLTALDVKLPVPNKKPEERKQ